jgi:hypothetical protein
LGVYDDNGVASHLNSSITITTCACEHVNVSLHSINDNPVGGEISLQSRVLAQLSENKRREKDN